MKRIRLLSLFVLGILSLNAAQVSDVRARQVPGTRKFEISYLLTGNPDERPFVSLEASADGCEVPVNTLEGDFGEVSTGQAERKIVWDAGEDWNDKYSDSLVFMVKATDRGPYMVVDVADIGAAKISYLATEPKDGQTDDFKTTKIVLKWVDPGSFVMAGHRHVTLTRGYYLGVFEITQQQWKNVLGEYKSYFTCQREMRPAESMSFSNILGDTSTDPISIRDDSFIGVLRSSTGCADFNLPTEAQWEYACRAGSTNDYYTGRDRDDAWTQR